MASRNLVIAVLMIQCIALSGQQRLGIGTTTPVRTIDVAGTTDQQIRIHTSSSGITAEAGLELVRGSSNGASTDWRIVNDGGIFKIMYGQDNFNTQPTEAMRINALQETGIGTISPGSKLGIDGGSQIIFGDPGYLKIGNVASYNLGFDNTQFLALNNGAPSPLYLQANGGNTNFGLSGGNTYMAVGSGSVSVGTTETTAALNIVDDNFQLDIDNDADDANHWRIGASNNGWQAGGNQLLFSPSSISDDAVLRLLDVNDNDGTNAPVMVRSTEDHTILMDGNEIDTRGTSLYINYNSEQDTYINPTGGMVGIGTSNPQAMLHVNCASGNVMTLQGGNYKWHFNPATGGNGDLGIYYNDVNGAWATIDGVTGQWTSVSDRNQKENIVPMTEVTEKLKELNVYQYTFRHDPDHKTMTGIIAQEAQPLFPQIVYQHEGQYGVSYSQLAAIGIKAIKEQQRLIDQLQEKVDRLKALSNPESTGQESTGSK